MKADVEQFAAGVQRFVSICEGHTPPDDAPENLFRALTELIGLAWRLPDDSTGKDPDEYGIAVSEADWRHVYSHAGRVIEKQFYDYTWPDGNVTTGDTADDLADIYRDLKPGLVLWQRGGDDERSGAVWSWQLAYESHWGAHADGLYGVLMEQVRQRGLDGANLLDGEAEFFDAVLARRPHWWPHLSRLPRGLDDRWTAQLEVPSPTGDPSRNFILWLSDGDPSIGFGHWHTHTHSIDALFDYVDAIERDRFVIITDVGGPYDGVSLALDLREEHALLAHLTEDDGPPKVRVKTFTGDEDREYP